MEKSKRHAIPLDRFYRRKTFRNLAKQYVRYLIANDKRNDPNVLKTTGEVESGTFHQSRSFLQTLLWFQDPRVSSFVEIPATPSEFAC